MNPTRTTRRRFLSTLGLAAVSLPVASALTACMSDERSQNTLTRAEGRTLRAFAAQILPPVEGHPGADELGVVECVDAILARPLYANDLPIVRAGLADLDARAKTIGARAGFASLRAEQQAHVIRDIEQTDFFAVARARSSSSARSPIRRTAEIEAAAGGR